jgi:hypothetical protein
MVAHVVTEDIAVAHRLADGTEYFGQLDQVAYDEAEDKVQCHLCGYLLPVNNPGRPLDITRNEHLHGSAPFRFPTSSTRRRKPVVALVL